MVVGLSTRRPRIWGGQIEARRGLTIPATPERVAVVGAMLVSGIVAEVMWTAHRRLPALVDIDASGFVRGSSPGSPIRVIALGDSTLTGPGITNPSEVWLHQALGRLEGTPSVEVISLAVGGSRLADVAGRIAEAAELEPDLMVLAVGANDAIHGTSSLHFASHLDAVLTDLLAAAPIVAVANIGDLGNVARVPRPLDAVLRRRSRSFCRTIERVVESHDRAVLLDVTPSNEAFRDRSVFGADLFHPSEVGHAHWADAALPGLQQAFDRLQL